MSTKSKQKEKKIKEIIRELNRFENKTEIKLYRVKEQGVSVLFYYKPTLYEYKMVQKLEEALELCTEGWSFDNQDWYFKNIALYSYRALNQLLKSL